MINFFFSKIKKGGGVCGCNESSIIAKLAEQVKQGALGPPGVDDKPGLTGIPVLSRRNDIFFFFKFNHLFLVACIGSLRSKVRWDRLELKAQLERKENAAIPDRLAKKGLRESGPKGEPGRGDLGKPGLPVTKGDRGTDGERGPNGDSGEPGLPGTKGEIVPASPVGTSVISSVEGAKENQGDRGKRGKPGPREHDPENPQSSPV